MKTVDRLGNTLSITAASCLTLMVASFAMAPILGYSIGNDAAGTAVLAALAFLAFGMISACLILLCIAVEATMDTIGENDA